VDVKYEGESYQLKHGSVVIAAITSCTNTSNPTVMLGAGKVHGFSIDFHSFYAAYVFAAFTGLCRYLKLRFCQSLRVCKENRCLSPQSLSNAHMLGHSQKLRHDRRVTL